MWKMVQKSWNHRRSPRIKFGFTHTLPTSGSILIHLWHLHAPLQMLIKNTGLLNSLFSASFKMLLIRIWSYTLNCFPYYQQGASLRSTIFDRLLYILELWLLNISGILRQNQTESFNQPYQLAILQSCMANTYARDSLASYFLLSPLGHGEKEIWDA